MQPSYIPARDADFNNWLINFDTLLTAAPATFGLTAPDALDVHNSVLLWTPAWEATTNPATRTSPAIAQKDAQRVATTAIVRPYAQQISRNDAVTPENKLAIGVNLPNNVPVPVPPPTTNPMLSFVLAQHLRHTLRYQDSGAGSGKAKPAGAIGMELYRSIGTTPAVDPDQCDYVGTFTKCPFASVFQAADVGKIATYYARWITRSGSAGQAFTGPWSPALTANII